MKFTQLFALIAVLAPYFLVASATAISNSELEQRAPAQANSAAEDSQQIDSDCNNHLNIHRVHGNCNPQNARGLRKSAHNCSGKNYFCFNTVTQRGTCMSIAAARKKNYEHGECFL